MIPNRRKLKKILRKHRESRLNSFVYLPYDTDDKDITILTKSEYFNMVLRYHYLIELKPAHKISYYLHNSYKRKIFFR